jgi:ABC-type branched-subunit amino acid transport system ATPase component
VSITLLYAARLGAWTNFIFAAGFVAALKLLPGGIVPSFERWGKAVRSRVGAKAPPAPPQLAKASTPEASKASERPVRHASSEVVLEASGVSKQFGAVTALEDVGLAVHRGEIHGIVGPNGAGKSTLLAIVSGLLRADEGTVTWLGQDVTRLPAWQRARMGMARSFQAAQVVPELTVRENVLLGRYIDHPRGLTRAILGRERARLNAADSSVDEALERLGLTEFADAECDSLPFGQVRLTELARCFVRRPGLLLLDEAAAGLDRADKILLVDQIRRLAAEGTTVCLIEHDTDLVSRACDNVTVLDLGTVLSRGTGAEIFQDSRVRASYMGQRGRAAPEGHGPDGGNGDG